MRKTIDREINGSMLFFSFILRILVNDTRNRRTIVSVSTRLLLKIKINKTKICVLYEIERKSYLGFLC